MRESTNDNRRWFALGALTLAVLAVGLDGTVLSVALPTLSGALHASESDLQWFSSSYLLVLAAAMLPAALLGDRYGRKKVMLLSLGLFAVGSAACAYSRSVGEFIAARVLLGIAGAGVIVMALSVLTVLFSEAERPRAVGIWAAANFLAIPIGPILGGYLLTNYWWGWVFLMNVPVAFIGLGAAFALLPESRSSERPAIDWAGVGLSVVGLVTVTYGLIRAGEDGWGDGVAWILIVAGLCFLVGFLAWERRGNLRGGSPLVDVALFRSASFTWGVLLTAVAVLAMIGVIFTMPQYFQGVRGDDAMVSGLRLLPLIGGLLLGAVPADRVARLLGAKVTVAIGFMVLAVGLSLGATSTVHSSVGFVALWMAIMGAGMGIAMATSSSAALSELSQDSAAIGSAVLQAVNKVGAPFGTAILGSVVSSGYLARLDLVGLPAAAAAAVRQSVFGGVAVADEVRSPALAASVRAAFVHGMDTALLVSGLIAAAGAVLALLFLPKASAPAAAAAAAAAARTASHEGKEAEANVAR